MFDEVSEDALFALEQTSPQMANAGPVRQQETQQQYQQPPQLQQQAPPPTQAVTPAALPGMGASPDGIGDLWGFGTQNAFGATLPGLEPTDTSPAAAARSAGFTMLATTGAIGAGIAAGGAWGGVAGGLLTGFATNAYRAQKWWGSNDPSEKHEAVVSGIMALTGLALGGFAAYKAYQSRADGGDHDED